MELPSLIARVAFGQDPQLHFPVYGDVSEHLRSLRTLRGRSNEREQPEAGVAEPVYGNEGGDFSPGSLALMTRMQHVAVWESVEYPLHTGHVERIPETWLAEDAPVVSPVASDITIALAAASVWGVLPEETTGDRIGRLLDWAGQPSGAGEPAAGYWVLGTSSLDTTAVLAPTAPVRDLDTGVVTLAERTVEASSPQSALSLIQETASAEPGVFFINAEGVAIFHDRNTRFATAAAGAALTFTDDLDTLSATRAKYQDLARSYSVDSVVNEVSITSEIDSVQTTVVHTDEPSYRQHFRRSAQYSFPFLTETEMDNRAQFELLLYAQSGERVERLEVKPMGQPDIWPAILALELGDFVVVERQGESHSVFVESIDHDATPGGWDVTLALSPADAYVGIWILGVSELDVTTRLAI